MEKIITLTFRSQKDYDSWFESEMQKRLSINLKDFRTRNKNKSKKWTPEEDAFLVNQLKTSFHPTEWLSRYLGRPTTSVNQRIQILRKRLTKGVVPYRKNMNGKVLTTKLDL
jgi:hypothetical protein